MVVPPAFPPKASKKDKGRSSGLSYFWRPSHLVWDETVALRRPKTYTTTYGCGDSSWFSQDSL